MSLAVLLLAAGVAGPASELDAAELKARIGRLGAAVTSIAVDYRSYSYEKGDVPQGAYFHKSLVAQAPSWYRLESGHGYDGLDWRDDPYRQVVYVTPDEVYDESLVDRSYLRYETTPTSALPGTLDNEFYFVATGLWPLTQRRPPGGGERAQVLADVARSELYDTVRPKSEIVRGRTCRVLEWPGRDALWLDVERGCALMRREKRDENGDLTYRYELGDHREDAASIWLPRWITREDFVPGAAEPIRNVRMEILTIDLAPIDLSHWDRSIAPGSVELDRGHPNATPVQRVPGGLDLIDQEIAWMKRVHPRDTADEPAAPRAPRWPIVVCVSFVLCGMIELGVRARAAARAG